MKNTDDDLLNAIDAAESQSYGSEQNNDLAKERANAIDMYLGRNVDPAPEGRSQAISRDVYDTIAWIKPSLLRIFTGGDEIIKIDPVGPEDEAQADQETAYMNHIIMNKNPWEQICRDWFTDALLTKNAYCMAFWDTSQRVEKETYERQSEDAMTLLLQEPGVKPIGQKQYPDDEMPPQPVMDQSTGQPVLDPATGQPQMQQPMLYDIQIKRTIPAGKLTFMVLPPERCKISEATPDFQLLECEYFEYWEYKTLSYIRSMGFDLDDDVPDDLNGSDVSGSEDAARDRYFETSLARDVGSLDPSMRKVRLRMVWIKYDYDGDGIAELQYCLIVGRKILYREDCNEIPVASIVPDPLPHRHIGLSIHDLISEIQEQKTAILRQGLDNLYLANNSRTFISEKINLDDLLVSQPGGIVRGTNGAVYGHDISPIVTPFVFPQAMEGMQFLDSVRQNRAGVNQYFTGVDQNALNKTAHGIAQLTSSSAQRVEDIGRIFAIGVKTLFAIAHGILLKHGRKAETIQLRGNWVPVDPGQWKRRTDFTINVGLGTGNREQVMQNLNMILQQQLIPPVLQSGCVKPDNVYATLSELTKAAGFANSDKFFTNPAQNPPQPPPPDPNIVLEQQKLQLDAQHKAGLLALDHERLQVDKAKAVSEDHLNRLALVRDTKMSAHQVNMDRHNAKAESEKTQMERDDKAKEQEGSDTEAQDLSDIKEAIQQLVKGQMMIAELLTHQNKPKVLRVQRQPDGSFVGSKEDQPETLQ